jgi:hypothetical protein
MLPIELYPLILAHCDKRSLVTCSVLCRAIQPFAEEFLWHTLTILELDRYRWEQIHNKWAQDRIKVLSGRLAGYIRRLKLSLDILHVWLVDKDPRDEEADLIHCLQQFRRVEFLEMRQQGEGWQLGKVIGDGLKKLHFPTLEYFSFMGHGNPYLVPFIPRHKTLRGFSSTFSWLPAVPVPVSAIDLVHLPPLTMLEIHLSGFNIILGSVAVKTLTHLAIDCRDGDTNLAASYFERWCNVKELTDFQVEEKQFSACRLLVLRNLKEGCYAKLFGALSPLFPNVESLSQALLTELEPQNLLHILPPKLTTVHLVFEGVMWDDRFEEICHMLQQRCKGIASVRLWAWSEAYYSLWSGKWVGGKLSYLSATALDAVGDDFGWVLCIITVAVLNSDLCFCT